METGPSITFGESIDPVISSFVNDPTQAMIHAEQLQEFVGNFINGFVPIILALVVITFYIAVIHFVFTPETSPLREIRARYAVQLFLVVFLFVNFWTFIRMIQVVTNISPLTIFLIMIACLFAVTAWSLFRIGDFVMQMITLVINKITNYLLALLLEKTPPVFVKEAWRISWKDKRLFIGAIYSFLILVTSCALIFLGGLLYSVL